MSREVSPAAQKSDLQPVGMDSGWSPFVTLVMAELEEVVGCIEDVIIALDGRRMVRFQGVLAGQPHVIKEQVVQEPLQRIRVKVVPTGEFGPADVQDIIQRVQQRLGAEVKVVVETVDQIPRARAGKFQAVVSLLGGDGAVQVEHRGICV